MNSASFDIVVSDHPTSVEEWRRAQRAPNSELPELTDDQKEVARKFGISAEEYARGVLAGRYGQERIKERSKRLGEIVQGILDDLKRGDRVVGVIAQMYKERWVVQVRTPSRSTNIAVQRELGDDLLDSGLREQLEQLRARLVSELGLSGVKDRPE